ncbi:MAG: hypothetical protein R3D57_02780 [Hyphomicrobiaceae bacterium]
MLNAQIVMLVLATIALSTACIALSDAHMEWSSVSAFPLQAPADAQEAPTELPFAVATAHET